MHIRPGVQQQFQHGSPCRLRLPGLDCIQNRPMLGQGGRVSVGGRGIAQPERGRERGFDDRPNHLLDGRIRLVEQVLQLGRVPIDAEHQLRQVVRTDREAVEALGELRREHHVRRNLAH